MISRPIPEGELRILRTLMQRAEHLAVTSQAALGAYQAVAQIVTGGNPSAKIDLEAGVVTIAEKNE
jgi:hypothetical protein